MEARASAVFVGSRVWTGHPGRRRASCLAVSGERILAVGSEAEVRALVGPETEVRELRGGAVLPGFHDAHLHLAAGCLGESRLDLGGAASAEEAASRVKERAEAVGPGVWIRGRGWDQTRWPAARFPSRKILDRAAPDNPVFLSRVDGHAAWLNTAALRLLGISSSTKDPPGGAILREEDGVEPSGILLERAMELAAERIPEETEQERRGHLLRALGELASYGITSISDLAPPWAVPLYAKLLEEGLLTARVSVALPFETDREEAAAWRALYPAGHPWLSVSTLKIFLDGTLGSRTAALLEPYADEPSSKGILRWEPDDFSRAVSEADSGGWAVAIHAIGDRAVRVALDGLERLPSRPRLKPHRIEHVQVVLEEDLPRFARAEVVCSVQPVHYLDDHPWIRDRLGPRPGCRLYPWASLLRAGATIVFGSDWPVASSDPRRSLYAAVARGGAGGGTAGDAAERLTLDEALRAATAAAGAAEGRDGLVGVLRRGALADLVVLDGDPFDVGPEGLLSLRVLETWVGGRRVYSRD
jgi:hypothetical protein